MCGHLGVRWWASVVVVGSGVGQLTNHNQQQTHVPRHHQVAPPVFPYVYCFVSFSIVATAIALFLRFSSFNRVLYFSVVIIFYFSIFTVCYSLLVTSLITKSYLITFSLLHSFTNYIFFTSLVHLTHSCL